MSNKISRRGFLGIVGAAGAAAVIPLSWEKPAAPVDISEYVDYGSIEIEGTIENPDFKDWKSVEGTISGYWDPTRPTLTVDGDKVDLESYDISFEADITVDTVFSNERTFIQGLKRGTEINCTTYHAEFLAELMKQDCKQRSIEIDTKDGIKFSCEAYPTSVEHHYSPYACDMDPGFLSNVTFKVVGEIIQHV